MNLNSYTVLWVRKINEMNEQPEAFALIIDKIKCDSKLARNPLCVWVFGVFFFSFSFTVSRTSANVLSDCIKHVKLYVVDLDLHKNEKMRSVAPKRN